MRMSAKIQRILLVITRFMGIFLFVFIGVIGLIIMFMLFFVGLEIGFAMAIVGFLGFSYITSLQVGAYDMKARAYLPKNKLGEIVPFPEDVLVHEYGPGWKRLIEKMESFFDELFGPDWKRKIGY